MIHNASLRKDMQISRKLYIRSDWRLEWWLLVIAAALVCLAGGSSDAVWGDNKELRVIRVQHEIDLGDRISKSAGPDYYISGGESHGLRVSMLLDVYRPLQIHDPFNEKDYDLITAIEIIGYLNEEDRILSVQNIKKKLKVGGYFLFSGGINRGKGYFEKDKIIKLISEYFKIVKIEYNYAFLYKKLEKLFDSKIFKFILTSERITRIFNYITKLFIGYKGATHILILAKKSCIRLDYLW